MSTSPRSQMDTATAFLAASLGMSREQLIGQVISQCLDELRDQESGMPKQPYVRLGLDNPSASDVPLTLIVEPQDDAEAAEIRYLEASKG